MALTRTLVKRGILFLTRCSLLGCSRALYKHSGGDPRQSGRTREVDIPARSGCSGSGAGRNSIFQASFILGAFVRLILVWFLRTAWERNHSAESIHPLRCRFFENTQYQLQRLMTESLAATSLRWDVCAHSSSVCWTSLRHGINALIC